MTSTQNLLSNQAFSSAAGSQSINSLSAILGPPEQSIDLRTVGSLSHDVWPLAKAYEGRSKFLEHQYSVFIGQTLNEFITSRILPLVHRDDAHFHLEYTEFVTALAPQTPVFSPAESVRAKTQRREFHMRRYALRTEFGVEATKTSEGKFIALGNLMNVGLSFGNTMQLDGILAITREENVSAHFGPNRTKKFTSIVARLDWPKRMFDALRKMPRGFDVIHEEAKKSMSPYRPTDVIVPPFTTSLIAADPAEREVFRAGSDARNNVINGGDAIGQRRGDLLIHTHAEYIVNDDAKQQVAPLKRIVTIGDHFDLTNHLEGSDPANFRSAHANIKVFDMSCGDGEFGTVTPLDVLRNCGRFEDDGEDGALRHSHQELADDVEGHRISAGLRLEDGFADMFLYSVSDHRYAVCQLLGHMEEQGLPRNAVRETALTVAARTAEQMAPGNDLAIQQGLSLIDRIYGKAISAVDVAFANAVVANAGSAVNDSGVLSGNDYGAHYLPAMGAFGTNYLPFGYGSIAGVRTIGALSSSVANDSARLAIGDKTIEIASKFSQAFEVYASTSASLFVKSHPAFDPELVPAHFESDLKETVSKRRADGLTTFGQNLLDRSKLPLYFKGAKAASFDEDLVVEGGDIDMLALNAIRKAIQQNVTPLLRKELGNEDAAKAFLRKYSESIISNAFAGSLAGRKSQSNRRFGVLANSVIQTHITNSSDRERSRSIASFMTYLIRAVEQPNEVVPADVEQILQSWFVETSPELQAALDTMQASGENSALTRLVAPLDQVRAARTIIGDFALASPYDSSQVLNTDDNSAVQQAYLDSRGDLQAAFIGSRAYPQVWGHEPATSNNKRSFSGAFENRSVVGGQFAANGYLQLTGNLLQRFRKSLEEEKNVFQRVARQLVLLTPIVLRSFEIFYDRHVRIPFDGRGSRLLRRYQTGSIIFAAINGSEQGETAHTALDVMLGANPSNKTMTIHVSMEFVSIVKKTDRFFTLRDCIVVDYYGGESLVPYSPESFVPSNEDSGRSVIYELQPAGSLKESCSTSDIRGHFSAELIDNSLTKNAYDALTKKPLTPSALYTSLIWDLDALRVPTIDDYSQFATEGQHNSITHRTMIWRWNPSMGDYSNKRINTGYFGRDIYEGHGALRVSGSSQHYQSANYLTNYAPM